MLPLADGAVDVIVFVVVDKYTGAPTVSDHAVFLKNPRITIPRL